MRKRPSPEAFHNETLSARQHRALVTFETPHSMDEIRGMNQITIQSLLYHGWIVRSRGGFVRSAEGDQVLYDYETADIMRKNAEADLCRFLREPNRQHRVVPFHRRGHKAA